MRYTIVLLVLSLLLLAAVPAGAQEPVPPVPRFVVGDILEFGNATPFDHLVIAAVDTTSLPVPLYHAFAVEQNAGRWEIPMYWHGDLEYTEEQLLENLQAHRAAHVDPVSVIITDPTITGGDMQYTGLSLAEALAGVLYAVEPPPGEPSGYPNVYVVGDILGNVSDPDRGSVVSQVYESDGTTWFRVYSDAVRSGDRWMLDDFYNNDMAFTASQLDQNDMRRVAHADPHTVIINDTTTSTGEIGWYRLSLAEFLAGKNYDHMGAWHFNTGDILGNDTAPTRYIVTNATPSDSGPSHYMLHEAVSGAGGWEIRTWINGGVPLEVPLGAQLGDLAFDLVDHTDPHFAIVTDPSVENGVTYDRLSLGEILEGLNGYPPETPGPVGGDRGYFLVTTVPAGAEIYLEDISGTRYLQGNTTAGPLNVTICLTCTPVRSLIASLAGYRDEVHAITEYPPKDQTVPITLTLEPATNGTPYRPHPVPGRVEAEDYDLGGEGAAYHDTTPGNLGGVYRSDDVDIEKLAALSTPNVGWIRNGEWLTYTVNVTQNGTYAVTARMASPNSGRTVSISVDGAPATRIAVPNTGSFGTFRNVSPTPIALPAGDHTLNLSFAGDGQNLDWLELAPAAGPAPGPNGTPYTPLAIPGTIEAEDYDLGGEGVAYHDTTPGNLGGAYRSDDVDIEVQGGITNVGWIRNGEYLTYTAGVASAGTYTMTARVASPNSGRSFAVLVDGAPAATVAVPNTGSFGTFRTVQVPVTLAAGTHTLTLAFTGDGQNLDRLEFAAGGATPGAGGSFVAVPTTAPHGTAFRFTVTPAVGKSIASAWWSFDAPAHLNTWNSRTINPTFYYFVPGTYSPLVRLTYTDGTTEEVRRVGYIRST